MRLFSTPSAWCAMPAIALLCLLSTEAAADTATPETSSASSQSELLSAPIDAKASEATYRIELIDGTLKPETLRVPAGVRFKLLIVNNGSKPGEFESHQLRQEVVLFMGNEKILPISPLDAGSYDYFDDFQPGVIGKIVAIDTAS